MHGRDAALHRLFARHFQFVLQMAVGDAQSGMDAGANRVLERLARRVDVFADGARQAADRAVLDQAADGLHRLEIAGRGDGKTRLDHIHAKPFQLPRNLDLLLHVEGRARRLLAVAQGGIENLYAGCH